MTMDWDKHLSRFHYTLLDLDPQSNVPLFSPVIRPFPHESQAQARLDWTNRSDIRYDCFLCFCPTVCLRVCGKGVAKRYQERDIKCTGVILCSMFN